MKGYSKFYIFFILKNFISNRPNKKWTTDVSQFNCPFGKAYLSPILDMVIGNIVA